MKTFKLNTTYSTTELDSMLNTLLDSGLVDVNELSIHKDFFKDLKLDFFSVNTILVPFSKNFFRINSDKVDLFRYSNDILGAYTYITEKFLSEPAIRGLEISFSIKYNKFNQYELDFFHKKGSITVKFSEFKQFIQTIVSSINLIFELEKISLICIPVLIVEDDFILFVDKLHAFKLLSERILNVTGILYPEVEQWIKDRINEPFAF